MAKLKTYAKLTKRGEGSLYVHVTQLTVKERERRAELFENAMKRIGIYTYYDGQQGRSQNTWYDVYGFTCQCNPYAYCDTDVLDKLREIRQHVSIDIHDKKVWVAIAKTQFNPGSSLEIALKKAYRFWWRKGRVIDGRSLADTLEVWNERWAAEDGRKRGKSDG